MVAWNIFALSALEIRRFNDNHFASLILKTRIGRATVPHFTPGAGGNFLAIIIITVVAIRIVFGAGLSDTLASAFLANRAFPFV